MASKASSAIISDSEEQQKLRFQVELEFVQCLANPNYLNFLAQRGYFKEQNFINYLKYLQYWKEPKYAKYLKYPQCLYLLDLLQYEHFRKELVSAPCAKFIDDQQLLHWQHYHRRRMHLIQEQQEKMQPPAQNNKPSNIPTDTGDSHDNSNNNANATSEEVGRLNNLGTRTH